VAHDLLLSSGFLAFARQCGFLAAVEDLGLEVDGVYGTSSGAMCGALWAAGMPAADIIAELSRDRPITQVRPSLTPWRGLFTMDPVVRRLRALLPATFAELPRPFGVGVRGPDGRQAWITEGDLPAAVAASCSMPWVFVPVEVGGVAWQDGGAVDRLGYAGWRRLRGQRAVVVHQVARTAGTDGGDDLSALPVARSPRSGASFFSLGDVAGQVAESRTIALAALRTVAAR
jgi:NTE family protein